MRAIPRKVTLSQPMSCWREHLGQWRCLVQAAGKGGVSGLIPVGRQRPHRPPRSRGQDHLLVGFCSFTLHSSRFFLTGPAPLPALHDDRYGKDDGNGHPQRQETKNKTAERAAAGRAMNVFCNAEMISCEDRNRVHSVLVEDRGKIVYMGNRMPEAYADVPPHDLGGRCVVPAFGDTHIHFESFALFHATLDCRHVSNLDELADVVSDYTGGHPSERLVLGFGCSAHTLTERRLPGLADLDRITAKPLFLIKYDGHAAVANSALIGALPPAVLGMRTFDRDSGWFYHEAFQGALKALTGSVSLAALLRSMVAGGDYLARKGVGLVHSAEGVGFPHDTDVALMRIAALGLPQQFRVYCQTMDVRKVLRRRLPRVGGCFATALDGCFGSEDAALRTPYANNAGNRGILFYPQSRVNEFVLDANRAGLQVAMHALGDAAVDQALCAFEAALKDHWRDDHRHTIIHADLMDEATIEKAASMGIHFALQTPFLDWPLEPMEHLQALLGDRLTRFMPLKSMLAAGLVLGNGSDAPCTLPDPIAAIHAACNHPNPDERIPVIDALRMHTNWAARLSFDERERGTLEAGKAADFVVLDRNPLCIPVDTMRETAIEEVYLGGKLYDGQPGSSARLLMRCAWNGIASLWRDSPCARPAPR